MGFDFSAIQSCFHKYWEKAPPNTFKSENYTKALLIFGNLISKCPNIRMKIIPVSLTKLLSGWIDRLKFISVQLDHSVVKGVGSVYMWQCWI